jgi:hypothetical protein
MCLLSLDGLEIIHQLIDLNPRAVIPFACHRTGTRTHNRHFRRAEPWLAEFRQSIPAHAFWEKHRSCLFLPVAANSEATA